MTVKILRNGVALAALLLAGCGVQNGPVGQNGQSAPAGAATPAGGTTQLTGAGATFPAPIYAKWFSAYQELAQVEVNYQAIGSGGGIQQLKNKTVDFGASDAPLSDAEAAAMPQPVLHIPTVAGAVAVVYNLPGLPHELKLTGATLAAVFRGDIVRWDDAGLRQLNPGLKLPATSITVAHRSDGSGTTNIFTSYLKATSAAWAASPGAGKAVQWPVGQGGKGNDGVASIVKQTAGAIGYVELAYAVHNSLSYASIRNRAGVFVTPSVDATTAAANGSLAAIKKDVRAPIIDAAGAGAYPIAGFTYILVYRHQADSAKGQALVKLLEWAIGDGQKMAPALYYAPLPAAVVALDKAALKTIG